MAVYDDRARPFSQRAGVFVNYAGAACSLALMAGIGVWGYQLIMRDVTGIPVVRAMTGEMRVAPENPGGEVALHTGLSVNSVAAEGEAAAFGDTLVLAPATQGLTGEDLDVQPMAEANEVVPLDIAPVEAEVQAALTPAQETEAAIASALTADDVLALADQIAGAAAPLSALEDGVDVAPTVSINGAPVLEIISASIPGVSSTVRPVVRPARTAAPAIVSETATASNEVAITTAALPVGTKLVQLGAYPSPTTAADAWNKLQKSFGDYMSEKQRVIQVASSGGNTFYRLRAMGFDDLNDARRFCAALEAGNADCIPVVVR